MTLQPRSTRLILELRTKLQVNRLISAYDDFVHTLDAHLYFSPERTGRGRELITEENFDSLGRLIMDESSKSVALLKASYLFAIIYMEMMIGTVINRPTISFVKFLSFKPTPTFEISKLAQPYSIAIYRNKLLAHHDKVRSVASMSKIGIGEVRIQPMGSFSDLSSENRATIELLRNKYDWHLNKSSRKECFDAPVELVTELFYLIEPKYGMEKTHDRITINNLAEVVGVRSHSTLELLEIVDSLTENIFSWHQERGK